MNVRPPTLDDVDAVYELVRDADLDLVGESEWTHADIREEWEDADLAHDAWIVELNGRVAGFASLESRGGGRLLADGYVHPELRGRGVGARILELTESRARERLPELALGDRLSLRNSVFHPDAAARALLVSRGYRPVRFFFRMVVDLDAPPPEPRWPDGIEAAPFDVADARAVHAALQESFAQEWGFRPESFEEFERRRLSKERFDPSLCWVAKDGDEVVGFSLNDWKRNGAGWIAALGVRRRWRGRGLGLALLHASFGELYRRGERRCALGVDAANPTGAVRLYERAGMRVLWQADAYEKEIRAA